MEQLIQQDTVYEQMIVNKALKERTLVLNEFVDVNSMYKIAYHMDRLKSLDDKSNISMEDRKPITIEISSGGGSCHDGLFLISKIESFKDMGYKIITRVNADACSMAFMIFIVGSERQMYRRSKLMFHQPSGFEIGYSTLQEKEDRAEELKVIWGEMVSICLLYTRLKEEELEQVKSTKTDRWFGCQEAIEKGICDKII